MGPGCEDISTLVFGVLSTAIAFTALSIAWLQFWRTRRVPVYEMAWLRQWEALTVWILCMFGRA